MSMYLPNTALGATGSEPAEFVETPDPVAGRLTHERARGRTARLDVQTRLNIARWGREYIAGLVAAHDGGPDDVRSILRDLNDA